MAVRSEVDICNLALSRLGAKRISDLAGAMEEERLCRDHYPAERDFLFRTYAWSFAIERRLLLADPVAPAWGYANRYQLPSDCSRVVQVDDWWPIAGQHSYNSHPEPEYLIEGRAILSNREAPLKLRYISRERKAPELFDDAFLQALVARLALSLCMPITQRFQLVPPLQQLAKDALIDAARVNAIEQAPVEIATPITTMVRL